MSGEMKAIDPYKSDPPTKVTAVSSEIPSTSSQPPAKIASLSESPTKAATSSNAPAKAAATSDPSTKVSVTTIDLEKDKVTKRHNVIDLPLNEDEKAQSRKSKANTFDQLVDVNLKLVDGVDRLVKVSYVVQATQLILVLVMLVIELTRR